MEETCFQQLRQFLMRLSAGPVPPDVQPELLQLLKSHWDMFSGSDQEGMEAYKLQRMEHPEWHPPVLTFTVERHGRTALGSTRADLQRWDVDLDRGVAECQVIGYRQVYPREAPVDVKPVADEMVRLIIGGSRDDRLQWSAGGRVRVLTGRIFPASFEVPKQTLEGRRKRFVKAMEERLAPRGWQHRGSWWERKE